MDILTPEQVHDVPSYTLAMLQSCQWPLEGEYIVEGVYARLEVSHEALRVERDSWQATAEELGDRNVNQSLTARHEMREQILQQELAKAQGAIRVLAELLRRQFRAAELVGTALGLPAVRRALVATKETP